jgi:MoaA/NifB/PqqE/SkfB family radical SAM enzyme
MPSKYHGLRRTIIAVNRRLRELAMIAKGVMSTDHPVMAHIIPMRRCNLSCAYCNEYDSTSQPAIYRDDGSA